MSNRSGSTRSKSLRIGGYSVVSAIIIIVVIILANVVVNSLPKRYTEIDISSERMYTLSETTEQIVKNADQNITMYWIVQDGEEDTLTKGLLERYEGLSSGIRVVKIDPDEQPTFVDAYNVRTLYNNSVIVEGEERFRYVMATDIYVKQYDYTKQYADGSYYYENVFDGESALTSAIDYVLNADLPKIYLLQGHNEEGLPEAYENELAKANIEFEKLDLINEPSVPEDCQVLYILNPEKDLSTAEAEMISEYITAGGHVILVTAPDMGSRPNIDSIAGAYGITEAQGMVIEGDSSFYASRYPAYCLLPKILSHEITDPLSSANYRVCLPLSGGLLSGTTDDTYSITKLLKTSTYAFSKVAGYQSTTYEKEEGDIDGPFYLALLVEVNTEKEDTKGMLLWVSSETIIDSDADSIVSGGNMNFFVNGTLYMTGQTDSISIRSRSLDKGSLTVTEKQSVIMSVIMIGVLPVALIAAGIIIVVRRRRR